MRLAELIDAPAAYRELEIDAVVADSRFARPGALFVARPGSRVDGHAFITDAVLAGCAAVAGSQELPVDTVRLLRERGAPYLRVADPAQVLGELAARINGRPSAALRVVGVTGTNGKTTVATLLDQLFTLLGERSGLIATTGIRIADERLPNSHTTPDAVELQRLLASMVAAGCRFCFTEVTSHAIDQRRIAGVEFAGGIFTTLGHDHLDYHGTSERYAQTKQRFFGELPASAFALANADDEHGRFMTATTRARVVFYGSTADALLSWRVEGCDEDGMHVRIGGRLVCTGLIGRHNAGNLAAALTTARLLGYDLEQTIPLVSRLQGAPGRMQRVVSAPVLGIVDYAHTPEAVRLALASARELRPAGRLLVVAGCGGDRDPSKRPAIGGALALADTAIFTADNPRSEDPHAIVAAMLAGVASARSRHVQVELDRAAAIAHAARLAEAGDVILLLGNGHETMQEIGPAKHPWDDAAQLRSALERASRRGRHASTIGAATA